MTDSIKAFVAAALTLLVLSLAPSTVAAAPPNCQSDSGCRGLLEKGIAQFKHNHYEIAIGFFKEAYTKVSDPRLLVFIGRSRFKLKQPAEALDNYQRALPDVTDKLDRSKLEQYISDARAALGPAAPQKAAPTAPAVVAEKPPATPAPTPEKSPITATENPPATPTTTPAASPPPAVVVQAAPKVETPASTPLPLVDSTPITPQKSERKIKPWAAALISIAAIGVVGTAVGLGVYYGTSAPVPDGKITYP